MSSLLRVFAFVLLLTPVGFAQQAPVFTKTAMPSYPNSTQGLEMLMKDMLELQKRGDTAALDAYFQSLALPHLEIWFTSKFGDQHCEEKNLAANDCLGPRLAVTYAETAKTLPDAARLTLRDLRSQNLTQFEAVNYAESCAGTQRIVAARKLVDDLTTTPILSSVLSGLIQHHEPVYVLWSYSAKEETTLAFFIYFDGAFRYIGMPHPDSAEDFGQRRASAKGAIEAARQAQPSTNATASDDLTNEVVKQQPVLADSSLIRRTAVMHVIIDKEGKVKEATFVRGPEGFKESAIEAVRKAHFPPRFLDGKPIQIDTCVSMELPGV